MFLKIDAISYHLLELGERQARGKAVFVGRTRLRAIKGPNAVPPPK